MAKKTIPITIGDTKLPNTIPNLNQILFKGIILNIIIYLVKLNLNGLELSKIIETHFCTKILVLMD